MGGTSHTNKNIINHHNDIAWKTSQSGSSLSPSRPHSCTICVHAMTSQFQYTVKPRNQIQKEHTLCKLVYYVRTLFYCVHSIHWTESICDEHVLVFSKYYTYTYVHNALFTSDRKFHCNTSRTYVFVYIQIHTTPRGVRALARTHTAWLIIWPWLLYINNTLFVCTTECVVALLWATGAYREPYSLQHFRIW